MSDVVMPSGLSARGQTFWEAVTSDYELSVSELELLVEVCRSLTQLDALAAAVEHDGIMIEGSMGQLRPHPAISQANATRGVLSRLLGQLALPDPDGESVPSPESVRARRAGTARWAGHVRPA